MQFMTSRMVWYSRLALVLLALCVMIPNSFAFGGKAKSDSSDSSSSPNSSANSSGGVVASVWVAKSDGSQMCNLGGGTTLEDGASELKKANVRVVSSQKGSDRKMHAQMCGLPSGHTNAYEIAKDDLGKAMVLGYQEIK
jgi:hypothetical protein